MGYRATLVVVLAMLVGSVAAGPASARPNEDPLERIARVKINQLRAEDGLTRLRRSPSLTRSASSYARYMLAREYFGHLSTIRAPLKRYRSVGEIILMHRGLRGRPRTTVKHWALSPGHRFVMLRARYRQIGIGTASGRFGAHGVTIWVAHVGRRWKRR